MLKEKFFFDTLTDWKEKRTKSRFLICKTLLIWQISLRFFWKQLWLFGKYFNSPHQKRWKCVQNACGFSTVIDTEYRFNIDENLKSIILNQNPHQKPNFATFSTYIWTSYALNVVICMPFHTIFDTRASYTSDRKDFKYVKIGWIKKSDQTVHTHASMPWYMHQMKHEFME